MQFMRLLRCLSPALIAAALAVVCPAQVMQAPGTMPDGHRIPVPGTARHPAQSAPPMQGQSRPGTQPGAQPGTTPATLPTSPATGTPPTGSVPFITPRPGSDLPNQPQVPPSLLDKPAQPATVKLTGGTLVVTANNSSLTAILNNLSSSSGMSIDGLGKDQRVFGIYGPGTPRDILSELLDGAGYNFLMVGETDAGVPREIVLTARTNAPLSAPGSSSRSDEDEEPLSSPQPEDISPPPIAPVNEPPQRPRSPQEMLQELQRLRQQQQQQQQPPQPQ